VGGHQGCEMSDDMYIPRQAWLAILAAPEKSFKSI